MNTVTENIFAEFNDELRRRGEAVDIDAYLRRCPLTHRKELLTLIETAITAHRALASTGATTGVAKDHADHDDAHPAATAV